MLVPTLMLCYFESLEDSEPRGIVLLNDTSIVEQKTEPVAGRCAHGPPQPSLSPCTHDIVGARTLHHLTAAAAPAAATRRRCHACMQGQRVHPEAAADDPWHARADTGSAHH